MLATAPQESTPISCRISFDTQLPPRKVLSRSSLLNSFPLLISSGLQTRLALPDVPSRKDTGIYRETDKGYGDLSLGSVSLRKGVSGS